MVSEDLLELLITFGVGLFFFFMGLSGYRNRKLQGFREAKTISDGEISEGEALAAKIIGALVMAFGLFWLYIAVRSVLIG